MTPIRTEGDPKERLLVTLEAPEDGARREIPEMHLSGPIAARCRGQEILPGMERKAIRALVRGRTQFAHLFPGGGVPKADLPVPRAA